MLSEQTDSFTCPKTEQSTFAPTALASQNVCGLMKADAQQSSAFCTGLGLVCIGTCRFKPSGISSFPPDIAAE